MPTKILKSFFILLLIFTTAAFGSIGRITALSGDVSIDRGAKKQKAIANFQLEERDIIISRAGASAQIIFDDKTVITIGANTNFKIEEYLFDEKTPKARFRVEEGAFKAITGKIGKIAPDKFKLETKTATIGIRGTAFVGNVDKDGVLTVACTRGIIFVMPKIFVGEPTIVKQGHFTKADTKGVEPPKLFTPQDIKNIEKLLLTDKKVQNEAIDGDGFIFLDRSASATQKIAETKEVVVDTQTVVNNAAVNDKVEQVGADRLINNKAVLATASPWSYTVIPSTDPQLATNALMVSYNGNTKYFKYAENTNTYGTDETFGSISELVEKLQAFTGSNVKFYLDPTTNQISYMLISGVSSLSFAKANSGEFLGFTNTLLAQTGDMQYSRVGLMLTKLADGSVFAVGGFNYGPLDHQWVPEQIYNPSTGQWTSPASVNTPSTGAYPRISLGATTLSNGKVLIAGGNDGWGWFFNNVDLYDTSTHTWTAQTSLPTALSGLGLVGINGGDNALAIGGNDGTTTLSSVLRFDPTANSGLGSWNPVAPMNTARNSMGAVTLQNGNVLVMGGENAGSYLSSVEYYNVAGDAWTYKSSMLTPRNSLSATLLQDGSVLAIGGSTTGNIPLSSVEQYDLDTNTWKYKVPLPFTLAGGSAVTLNDGSVLIAGGNLNGSNGGYTTASSWIYNPNQYLTTTTNTILAADYNAGVNDGFFIGSTNNMGSKVVGNINSMLFSAESSAAGLSIDAKSGQLGGTLGSLSGVTNGATFEFSHYVAPSTTMVNYIGEDNKIIWGQTLINDKAGTIGFASLPDKVDSNNALSNVNDFSSWGYWEATTNDSSERYSGYWVSGQTTAASYVQQMINQNQTYSYSGHVIGDTLNASNVKDSIVLDNNNRLNMTVSFGSANPIAVNSLSFRTSQGWNYNQSTNLTSSSTLTGASYSATIGNSVNVTDSLSVQGKFYGPQANSTGGVFSGQLTGTDATQRLVQGGLKATR